MQASRVHPSVHLAQARPSAAVWHRLPVLARASHGQPIQSSRFRASFELGASRPAGGSVQSTSLHAPGTAHVDRRGLMMAGAAGLLMLQVEPASAGLVQFPANRFNNRYILVRAGESYADEQGVVSRNPVWKTSQRYGLSRRGIQQVVDITAPALEALGACEDGACWLWPSIWQSSYMTAEILASELALGRSRIVPEYSFLDARGLGALEGQKAEEAAQLVASMDEVDPLWRPPKGEDGTPHESTSDLLVRVRQVMSICETQYRNDDILIIAPDPDTLSVLQAAVLGIDLRAHTRFTLPPGGVRELALSTQSFDDQPRRLSCPNPPSCLA